MKIKNLTISLLLSTTIQAGFFLLNTSSSLAMYTPNSSTIYRFETDILANVGKLTIDDCPNGYLNKKVIDDTISKINASLPPIQILIPRTLVLGVDIKKIDIDVFDSFNLRNLKTLILPNGSSIIQQISSDEKLKNILTKNNISIEDINQRREEMKPKKRKKLQYHKKYNKWLKSEHDLIVELSKGCHTTRELIMSVKGCENSRLNQRSYKSISSYAYKHKLIDTNSYSEEELKEDTEELRYQVNKK